MGIDIYMQWDNQTEEEEQAQYTGFSLVSGDVGYLREAYHGSPYATRVLVPEAFDEYDGARIPAATLRSRLEETKKAAIKRARVLYNREVDETDAVVRSFEQFVELAERKEKETGKPVTIIASY